MTSVAVPIAGFGRHRTGFSLPNFLVSESLALSLDPRISNPTAPWRREYELFINGRAAMKFIPKHARISSSN